MSVIKISAKDLQQRISESSELILLDVREPHEFQYAHIEGSIHIPLNQIPQKLHEIDTGKACVVICHHGMRSLQAANFMVKSGFSSVYNLSGGIDAWSVDCDSTVSRY